MPLRHWTLSKRVRTACSCLSKESRWVWCTPCDIWPFLGPLFSWCFLLQWTFCLFWGLPSLLTFTNVKNHEKGNAGRGQGEIAGEAKNKTLCARCGVVRVFLFNVASRRPRKTWFSPKVGVQGLGFRFQVSGSRFQVLGFRFQGSGFGVWSFGVQGLGFSTF